MLAPRHRDVHDSRRRLHAGLRLLRGLARPAGHARSRRTGSCRRCCPHAGPAATSSITSVDRDDLADGGASIFAETIRRTRSFVPACRIEVLIPDFQGKADPLRTVLDAAPDVLNHNTETVPRLYRMARSGGRYSRTLELLRRARAYAPRTPTKTGLMVGLGEERDEIVAVMRDLRACGVEILTIGQYLRPTDSHLPMVRYYHPSEFAELKQQALEMGFGHVESGPLVRSSYQRTSRPTRSPPAFRCDDPRQHGVDRARQDRRRSSPARLVRGCVRIASASRASSAPHIVTTPTGVARSRASAIRGRNSSSSVSPRVPMARIAPGGCSPGTVRASSSCGRSRQAPRSVSADDGLTLTGVHAVAAAAARQQPRQRRRRPASHTSRPSGGRCPRCSSSSRSAGWRSTRAGACSRRGATTCGRGRHSRTAPPTRCRWRRTRRRSSCWPRSIRASRTRSATPPMLAGVFAQARRLIDARQRPVTSQPPGLHPSS